jgi:undecaprenyl-diphosphatase
MEPDVAEPSLSLLQIVVLALLQGVTEFLPISSAAHLILVPVVTGWPDQGIEIDIAVHLGTLGAVLLYLRREVWRTVRGLGGLARLRYGTEERLALSLVVATLPLLPAGGLLAALDATEALRSPALIAVATIVGAVVLYAADRWCRAAGSLAEIGVGRGLLIGLAQVLALVPGTSRSGATITAARFLGLERRDAARYSMLMSVPAILAAGGYLGLKVVETGDASFGPTALVAAALAFLAALVAIWLMMRWLQQASYTPFVVYRLLLGAALTWWCLA